jgi:hypothetical protein
MGAMAPHERIALAALVSATLHALLVAGAWVSLPPSPPPQPPLEARLAPAPPVAKAAALPEPRLRHSTRSRPHEPVTTVPAPSTWTAQQPEPFAAAPEAQDEPETAVVAAAPDIERAPQRPPAPAPASEPAPALKLPKKGQITYQLTFGGDRWSVGRAVQSWELEGEHYLLATEAQTTGPVDLFRPQRLRSLSKGRITRQGLKPASFLTSRTRRGQTETAQASFNWEAGRLNYGSARSPATAALPAGTQDLMSFIYQLAMAPPAPGSYRLPITTGTRFETYDIDVLAEESIETPLGVVRALPVRQQRRAGAESIEIWLAAEYRYLPVRIRYFDREGNPTVDQVAAEIRISEQ